MDTIGSRIRTARKAKGLTMKQLHDLTGLSTGNISDIENGHYTPSVAALVPLKQALGCSIDWLLSGDTEGTPISEHPISCDGVPLSQMEQEVIAMLRLLTPHDRKSVIDIVTMFYEQATGKKGSIYSTYIEDEYRQTSGPAGDGSESVIA